MKDWREVFKTEIMESNIESFSKLIVYLTVCLIGIPVIHKSIFNSVFFLFCFLIPKTYTHILSLYSQELVGLSIYFSNFFAHYCFLQPISSLWDLFFSELIYFHSGSLGNSLHLSVWNVFFFLILLSFSLFNNSYSCGTMLLGSSS